MASFCRYLESRYIYLLHISNLSFTMFALYVDSQSPLYIIPWYKVCCPSQVDRIVPEVGDEMKEIYFVLHIWNETALKGKSRTFEIFFAFLHSLLSNVAVQKQDKEAMQCGDIIPVDPFSSLFRDIHKHLEMRVLFETHICTVEVLRRLLK